MCNIPNVHETIWTSFTWSDVVDRKSLGDQRDLEECKRTLYTHGVLQYCSSSLRFSPAQIQGGCAVLTQMADILRYFEVIWTCRFLCAVLWSLNVCWCLCSSCCVGLGSFRGMEVFSHQFLPPVAENLLFLADRLMNRALRVRSREWRRVITTMNIKCHFSLQQDKAQNEMIRLFRRVFDSIGWLLRAHRHLSHHGLWWERLVKCRLTWMWIYWNISLEL